MLLAVGAASSTKNDLAKGHLSCTVRGLEEAQLLGAQFSDLTMSSRLGYPVSLPCHPPQGVGLSGWPAMHSLLQWLPQLQAGICSTPHPYPSHPPGFFFHRRSPFPKPSGDIPLVPHWPEFHPRPFPKPIAGKRKGITPSS